MNSTHAQPVFIESVQPATVIQMVNYSGVAYTYGLNSFGTRAVFGVAYGMNGYGIRGTAVGDGVGVSSGIHSGWAGFFSGGIGVYASPRLIISNFSDTNTQYPVLVGYNSTTGNGAHLTAGGTWTNGSSKDFKTDLESIDPLLYIEMAKDLDIYYWRYKVYEDGEHLGPVAEDFAKIFSLGRDDKYISTVDADGVNLSLIQGLASWQKRQNELLRQLNQLVTDFEETQPSKNRKR
ncbi:MAG: hypothetical protein IPL46_03745 [Saprospiraceae bacterium]|nr:hypothetical protein [Saprospiraceae bacterium]